MVSEPDSAVHQPARRGGPLFGPAVVPVGVSATYLAVTAIAAANVAVAAALAVRLA
jgi:hypothetical protein